MEINIPDDHYPLQRLHVLQHPSLTRPKVQNWQEGNIAVTNIEGDVGGISVPSGAIVLGGSAELT